MCDPVTLTAVAVGASIGAGTAAATGGDPLMGAVMGGATGAFFPGGVGVSATNPTIIGGSGLFGSSVVTGFGSTIALGGVAQAAGVGLLGGKLLNPILNPKTPDYSSYYPQQQQQYNSSEFEITGSGGTQAAGVLAQQIKKVKARKENQRTQGDLGLTTIQETGLQFA